jgi:hypothetical protein
MYVQCYTVARSRNRCYHRNTKIRFLFTGFHKIAKKRLLALSFDVYGSVRHRNINLIERTNKMRPCSRIYYSNAS